MKIFAALDNANMVKEFFDKTGIILNYLISYNYIEGQAYALTNQYRSMINELYLDSGAYSVATGRSKISVSEYAKYLSLYGDRFDQYFNLDDSFDDPEHNQENQKYLEENLPQNAKRPIPVVHDNEDLFSEFELYVNWGHDFIALGSTIKIPPETMNQIKERYPQVKTHLFGKTSLKDLQFVEPYSADSTTWSEEAAFGSVLYWDEEEKKSYKIYLGSKDKHRDDYLHYKTFEKKDQLDAFLNGTFRYQYSDLLKQSGSIKRRIVNLYYYKQIEDYLTSLEA